MKKTKVLIGTPLKGGVGPEYAKTMVRVLRAEQPLYQFEHIFIGGTCVMGARDQIMYHAEKMGVDHVVFWDADMKPSEENFARLLSHPEDFVCAPYCKREALTHWHFQPLPEADILPNGLWEMRQAAIGFSKISMKMIKAIKAFMPEKSYKNQEQGVDMMQLHQYFPWDIAGPNTAEGKLERIKEAMKVATRSTDFAAVVEAIVKDDDYSQNMMVGEDYWFCRLARKAGFKVWLDSKLIIPHRGDCDFPISHEDLIKMTAEPWRQEFWEQLKKKQADTP